MRGPVHHAGVELHFAFFVGQTAVSNGVVIRIVFDDGDSGNDRLEGVAPLLQDIHTFIEGMKAIGAGNDERAFALRGRREACESWRIGAVRTRASK